MPDAAVVSCTPKTCVELGAQCGEPADGCGGMLSCGTCSGGAVCSAALRCETTCTPTTCAAQNAECGTISNGCNGTLLCGNCGTGETCNNSNHLCECAASCAGKECGGDGCGGSCGTCPGSDTCSAAGQCVHTPTMPPSTWLCNAAYWDAQDGCDCNCGALDPDCGLSGQQLHGCTGLSNPTCNASGLCTGGGACNAVPTGSYLTLYLVNQNAPTMTGGTIVPGRWEATGVTKYTGPNGAYGYVGGDGFAIEMSGSTWKRVIRRAGGYPNVDENFTASVSGSTVTLTRTCPSALTETVMYSATATSLKIARQVSGGVEVATFAKKW
ncbi:MAG TPA: hypothetical protein VIV11_10725 [Kofleriaceae bacterium]